MKVLVTGATGYIGGRIIQPLIEKGHSVAVLTRDPARVESKVWAKGVDRVIKADLLRKSKSWTDEVYDFDVAYYLVHSLYAGQDFHELDKKCARNFGQAAKNIKHVIYLGGLVPQCESLSEHLRSREETGKILGKYVPLTEFRAGPIIGSGSAPFEMVRYLTERIPIMVTPKWIRNKVQPIAVRDVISYLVEAAEKEPLGVVDIGANKLSFKGMMQQYSKIRKLDRKIFALPVLTPNLAARWVGLVTPIPNSIAVPLIEGVIHPVTAKTAKAKEYFPEIKPITYREAVKFALKKIESELVETHWTSIIAEGPSYTLMEEEGLIKEEQIVKTKASPEKVFKSFLDIGGETGWPTMNWAWQIRGWVDKLVGGPGLIRGRRPGKLLSAGDTVDFWRVERIVENEELLLRAEMKLPGKAWLRFRVVPDDGGSMVVQTAFFEPLGLWGALYWYSLYPVHKIIFPKMVKSIVKKAEKGG